ncbi:MAG: hypothetical protein AAB855_00125, partial [Patescibacteria group bacterium]
NHVNNPPVIATANLVALASDATTVVDAITINEDASNSFVSGDKSKGVTQQTLTLAGIAPGTGDTETDQTVTVSIESVDSSSFITGVQIQSDPDERTLSFSATSLTKTSTLRYTPVTDKSGDTIVTIKLKDNSGGPNDTTLRKIKIKISPVNDDPVLAAIVVPTAALPTSQGAVLRTTLTDVETTSSSKFTLSAKTSSDTTLVPLANIVSDPLNRFVTITPVSSVNTGGEVTVNVTLTYTDEADGSSPATTVSSGTLALKFNSALLPNAAPVIVNINGI